MPPSKTVSALETTPSTATFLSKLFGAVCVGSFVVIWINSIGAPIYLVISILHERYVLAAAITLVTMAAYLPWSKGPLSRSVSNFFHVYHACYYKSVSVEFEGNVPSPSDKQTFYAIHPHGAFCIGWATLFTLPTMAHVTFCFSPALYASPFFRLFSRLTGTPGSAARSSMVSYMKDGKHLALPPGGFEEATLTSTEQDRVFIKKRYGFIRLCLMNGLQVRPVYVFGERNLFWNIQGMWKLRLAINRLGFPAILVWGHTLFPIIPKNTVDLKVVAGAPLVLPRIENPTKDDVALWHGKYIDALTKLFEEYKEAAYGIEEGKVAKLEVW